MAYFPFEVALQFLKEGGKIARDFYEKGSYLTIKDGIVQQYYPPHDVSDTGWRKLLSGWCEYRFETDDILANDWVFVLAEDNDERPMQGMVRSFRKWKV